LTLQLLVLLGPQPGLPLVGYQVVDVHGLAVGPEHGPAQATLLEGHDPVRAIGRFGGHCLSTTRTVGEPPIKRSISALSSPRTRSTERIRRPLRSQVTSCMFFSLTSRSSMCRVSVSIWTSSCLKRSEVMKA